MIEGLPCKALHCEGGGRVGAGREGLIVGYWTQSQARASGVTVRGRREGRVRQTSGTRDTRGYSPQTVREAASINIA